MSSVTLFSPAKLNLFLAVTGRRADGYHDLLSVAVPLGWGDRLTVELKDEEGGDALVCDDPAVPLDNGNLVLRASQAFRAASGWKGGAKFFLEKQIPMGSGLGGGSSNATAALLALNELAGEPLSAGRLLSVAAQVGSDCALFLGGGPVVMRGRGETIEPLPPEAAGRLRGRRVLIFKPGFGIATHWAYAQLAERAAYLPAKEAEARLASWTGDPAAPAESLLFNNLEIPAFEKFVALPALLDRLRAKFALVPRLTGSGSACFAIIPETGVSPSEVAAEIRADWGESSLVVETVLGGAES